MPSIGVAKSLVLHLAGDHCGIMPSKVEKESEDHAVCRLV